MGSKGEALGRFSQRIFGVAQKLSARADTRPPPDRARSTGAALEAHYRFVVWLVPTLERFPRSQKFLRGGCMGPRCTVPKKHRNLLTASPASRRSCRQPTVRPGANGEAAAQPVAARHFYDSRNSRCHY